MAIPKQESLFQTHAEEEDEVTHWASVQAALRARAAPLAHLLGHKAIAWPMQRSGGQLSKELNGTDDKDLSALALLIIADKTKDEELARLISNAIGRKTPDLLSPPDLREENKALRTELARVKAALRTALGGSP